MLCFASYATMLLKLLKKIQKAKQCWAQHREELPWKSVSPGLGFKEFEDKTAGVECKDRSCPTGILGS